MDPAKLNDWLQVVGLFGVMAGLAFVGMQLKQDREIAMAEAYHARAETTVALNMAAAANPLWLTAQHKLNVEGVDALTPEERLANIYVRSANFHLWDSIFYHYEIGLIDEEQWQRTRSAIRISMGLRSYRDVYDISEPYMRLSLRAEVDRILAELEAE